MATTMSHLEISVPGDDMEVSSDIGRPNDEPFDIDIDFDENPQAERDEDSMMDDTIEQPADDLMRDGVGNDIEYEDGIMLDGDIHLDEDIPDAAVDAEGDLQHVDIEETMHEVTADASFDTEAAPGFPLSESHLSLTTDVINGQEEAQPGDAIQSTTTFQEERASDPTDAVDPAANAGESETDEGQAKLGSSSLPDHNTAAVVSELYQKNENSAHSDQDASKAADKDVKKSADQLDTLVTQDRNEFAATVPGSALENTSQIADVTDQDASEKVSTPQDFGNETGDHAAPVSKSGETIESGIHKHEAADENQEAPIADGNLLKDEPTTRADEPQGDLQYSNDDATAKYTETHNNAAGSEETTTIVRDDASGDKMCPAILSFEGADLYLFPHEGAVEEQTSVLEDTALVYGPISDLLKTCRMALVPESSNHEYLIFDFPDLSLHVAETSPEATHTSLKSILEVHSSLCLNDSNSEVPALRITTLLRSDCSSRLAELESAIAQGKGYDYLFPSSEHQDGPEEEETSTTKQEDGEEEDYDYEEEAGEEDYEGVDAEGVQEQGDEETEHTLQNGSIVEDAEQHESKNFEQEDTLDHQDFEDHETHHDENEQELDFGSVEEFQNGADDFGRDDFAAFEEPAFDEPHSHTNGDDLGDFGEFVDNDNDELHFAPVASEENPNDALDSNKGASRKRSWDDAHVASDEPHSSQEAKKSRPS